MYNQEIKEEFIELQSKSYKKQLESSFKKIGKIEDQKEKDLAYFSKEIIVKMYEEFDYTLKTTKMINKFLSKYSDFYFKKMGETHSRNQYIDIDIDAMRFIKVKASEKRMITHQEMLSLVDDILNPCDKFLMYALYCGIAGTPKQCELCFLDEDDLQEGNIISIPSVDKEGNVIKNARFIKADDLLYSLAKESANTYVYKSTLSDSYDRKLYTNRILKPASNEAKESNLSSCNSRLRSKFTTICEKYFVEDLTAGDIKWSGIIYNMRLIQVEMNLPSIFDVIKTEQFKKLREQYSIQSLRNNAIKESIKKYIDV